MIDKKTKKQVGDLIDGYNIKCDDIINEFVNDFEKLSIKLSYNTPDFMLDNFYFFINLLITNFINKYDFDEIEIIQFATYSFLGILKALHKNELLSLTDKHNIKKCIINDISNFFDNLPSIH